MCVCVTYCSWSRKVDALSNTLAHVSTEEAHTHTLQVLRGNLYLKKKRFLICDTLYVCIHMCVCACVLKTACKLVNE